MHLTLKKEATKLASFNFLQQQSRFDQVVTVYNQERPHHALNMKYPAEVYTPSARQYRPPEEADKSWLVSFLYFDLGFFDQDEARVEPAPNPFAAKVLTM